MRLAQKMIQGDKFDIEKVMEQEEKKGNFLIAPVKPVFPKHISDKAFKDMVYVGSDVMAARVELEISKDAMLLLNGMYKTGAFYGSQEGEGLSEDWKDKHHKGDAAQEAAPSEETTQADEPQEASSKAEEPQEDKLEAPDVAPGAAGAAHLDANMAVMSFMGGTEVAKESVEAESESPGAS